MQSVRIALVRADTEIIHLVFAVSPAMTVALVTPSAPGPDSASLSMVLLDG